MKYNIGAKAFNKDWLSIYRDTEGDLHFLSSLHLRQTTKTVFFSYMVKGISLSAAYIYIFFHDMNRNCFLLPFQQRAVQPTLTFSLLLFYPKTKQHLLREN